eukprot:s563_g12.t1
MLRQERLVDAYRSVRRSELTKAEIGEPHLYFTLQDKPAILEKTADIPYHGHIKKEVGLDCYVSFPGKYAAGWDALIKEHHGQSVACVFLCTPADGLGKHHQEEIGGQCFCPKIYGQRDFRTFGYLKELPASCSQDEEKFEVEKAKATKTVVFRADASNKDKQEAEEKARQTWEESGRVASWGCEWFQKWLEKVAEAVKLKQRLKVVFFPGQTGKGIVPFEDLNSDNVNLWDGVGCGGSQKCEIAYLERMRQQEGDAWDYDYVDVSHFLKEEFKVGNKVDAWDGELWCRGTLVGVPSAIPKKPEDANWTIQSQASGHLFVTDRVRHADFIQKMLAEVGRDKFMGLVIDSLPREVAIVKDQEFIFPDGTPSLAVRLRIQQIEILQYMRNLVLSNDLEIEINKYLTKWQVCVDKTHFCKAFERELLNLSDLTDHQKQKLKDIKELMKHGDVHLSSPAGSGKTFVAAQCALDKLRGSPDGKILFVAPSIGLGLYFVRWLAHSSADYAQLDVLLKRMVLMQYPYKQFLSLHVEGDRLRTTTLPHSKMQFLMTIIDEAHDVFCAAAGQEFLEEKVEAPRQVLLLSSHSQSSSSASAAPFPPAKEISLTQVVRSTQRIVAGAAAFQASAAEKEQIGSLCPAGPPLKAFLFESDAEVFEDYARQTMSALFFAMRSYAGLSLHNRLALLVPNRDFLEKFQDAMQRHFLTARLAGRNFKLISFTESLCTLPNIKVRKSTPADNSELIILDTVENAKGLESLIVVCIGLDQRVADQSANQARRSIIYQAITRAQLQVLVVNQLLRGGWLEFLGVTKFKNDTFDESAAIAETTTDAAEALTKVQPPGKLTMDAPQADSSKGSKDAQAIQRDAEETGAVPPSKPMSQEDQETRASGDKPGDKLVAEIKDSSVWDPDVIDIKEPISQLQFDPRSPTGKTGDEVTSLEAQEVGAQEAADAKEAAGCRDDIFEAAANGYLGAVRHILRTQPGAAVEESSKGRTALHFAAEEGHVAVCRMLLEAEAVVDARDHDRDTPLHRAASYGETDVVKLLLEWKASVTAKEILGRTPLDLARSEGRAEIVQILEGAETWLHKRADSRPEGTAQTSPWIPMIRSQSTAGLPPLAAGAGVLSAQRLQVSASRSVLGSSCIVSRKFHNVINVRLL